MKRPEDFAALDAVGQAQAVRDGEASIAELVEDAIERIERLDPRLNAIVTTMFDDARRRVEEGLPDGPFTGVPIVVKDFLCPTAGDPYYEGIKGLRARGWRSPRDSYVAQRLRAAGFVILGRASTPELAMMATTEPLGFGATRNPWSLDHSVGGSSGGSCAAVAGGMVAAAHASDGAGSIRIPASMCGLVGLKPSRGRMTPGPDRGESLGSIAVEGAVTRSVRDTATLLDVLAGPMPGDMCVAPTPRRAFVEDVRTPLPSLRIGLVDAVPGVVTHPDCLKAVTITAERLKELGHHVERVDGDALTSEDLDEQLAVLRYANVAAALGGWSARTGSPLGEADVEPMTWVMAQRGRMLFAVDLVGVLSALQAHGRRIAAWCAESFDVLLTPTIAEPPPSLGEFHGDDPMLGWNRSHPFTVFTKPFNVSGQPAISLPVHRNGDNLPIGVQLAGGYGREALLLGLASRLERHSHPGGWLAPEHPAPWTSGGAA